MTDKEYYKNDPKMMENYDSNTMDWDVFEKKIWKRTSWSRIRQAKTKT